MNFHQQLAKNSAILAGENKMKLKNHEQYSCVTNKCIRRSVQKAFVRAFIISVMLLHTIIPVPVHGDHQYFSCDPGNTGDHSFCLSLHTLR